VGGESHEYAELDAEAMSYFQLWHQQRDAIQELVVNHHDETDDKQVNGNNYDHLL
jgi:hypothetical protein